MHQPFPTRFLAGLLSLDDQDYSFVSASAQNHQRAIQA